MASAPAHRNVTVKGRLASLLAKAAVTGPWRPAAEKLMVLIGHKFPNQKLLLRFFHHFIHHLARVEGQRLNRIATFATGGRMYCGEDPYVRDITLAHYFVGTITGQDQDEIPISKLFHRMITEGNVFFDIGANVGFYTFFAAPLVGKSGSVHAFEANPKLIPHLLRSAELNASHGRIVINNCAVGSVHGQQVSIYLPCSRTTGGTSLHLHDWLDPKSKMFVPMVSIDEYVQQEKLGRLDAVKIDIEGGELGAFKGMKKTFETIPPSLIVCELMSPSAYHMNERDHVLRPAPATSRPQEILSFMRDRGYEAWHISRGGRLDRKVHLDEIERMTGNTMNVAFVRRIFRDSRPDLFACE